MKLYLLNKSPQLKSLSHNLCHFSGHEQTRSFLLLYSQKWKAMSIRKCLPVSFRSYVDLTQLLAFFLDLFVYLLRCLMISLYWDVSCVWAQYIYLESGKSTMPIEPCHVFARWGVTLISCGYLPVKPQTAPFPPGGEGGEKDFIILSAFSMCNAFTDHCS